LGSIAAGHPNSFDVPYVKNANAATIRRTLWKYGAAERQRAVRVDSVVGVDMQ
jgi:hypothetical protein